MPTLLLKNGFCFFFYSNEGNEPPHVHVEYGDGEAKFWIDPIEEAAVFDMKPKDVRDARQIIEQHRDDFLNRWKEYHNGQ